MKEDDVPLPKNSTVAQIKNEQGKKEEKGSPACLQVFHKSSLPRS